MKHPLIYRKGREVILLDPYRERRIGVYLDWEQAQRAWDIYTIQGRSGEGFEYEGYDEYVTDSFRKNMQPFLTSKAEIK